MCVCNIAFGYLLTFHTPVRLHFQALDKADRERNQGCFLVRLDRDVCLSISWSSRGLHTSNKGYLNIDLR